METVIGCGRVVLSANYVLKPPPGERYPLHTRFSNRIALMAKRIAGAGKGGGLLDKPVIEKATPGRESEFDLRKLRKTSPPYRVLLHNDNYNKREYVVQV